MNNAEAVNWLINITADIGKIEHQDLWHYEQALSEIRELLEAQPEVIACGSGELIVDATGDLISRQAAIDALGTPHGILYPIRTVEELPSVQPERRAGRWIKAIDELGEAWSCSVCTTEYTVDEMDSFREWARFCPNCGADMRGEQNERSDQQSKCV